MSRPASLEMTPLEPREVPAAGAFADVMPGIWGSYPRDFTASGDVMYFAADNGHGEEVYRTDGTAGGTKLIKTLRPGRAGADPRDFAAAGNGVLYYTADDGTGRALYKTDGTAAGTVKIPGMPYWSDTASHAAVAYDGAFYFRSWTGWRYAINRTDGGAPVELAGANDNENLHNPFVRDGRVYFNANDWSSGWAGLWETDGTVAGTRRAVYIDTVSLPNGLTEWLRPEAELSPGRWLMSASFSDKTFQFWVKEGSAAPTLVKSFPPVVTSGDGWTQNSASAEGVSFQSGGAALFRSAGEWWRTDGTPEGTREVGRPPDGSRLTGARVATFANRLLTTNESGQYVLTDGTAAGTAVVARPDGGQLTGSYTGKLAPGPAHPGGVMAFTDHTNEAVRLLLTDGTPAGGRWVDASGVPEAGFRAVAHSDLQHYFGYDGAELNGTVYFAGPRVGDVRPEPWKWDIAPRPATPPTVPPPAPVVPPKVASVVVNGGEVQRSMVTTAAVTFDRAVDLAAGAVEVKNQATGQLVAVKVTTQLVAGKTVATVTFGGAGVVGGSLADGVYTLTVRAAKVTTAGTTTALAADATTTLHRLFGDLDGDRTSDRASRHMVYQRLGATRGQATYLAAFDFDGNGVIDQTDDVAIVRRWGRSV